MENCVVCFVQFSQNDISLVKFTDEDSKNRDKISCVYRKILRIFCKYFNLPCQQSENEIDGENPEENGILSSFPFCVECRNLVAELCIFHEKSESIHKIIRKTVAKITMKIVQTENDKENCSYSDPLENRKNGARKRNKISYGYRRQILQNFNPRVLLLNCQNENQNQKKLPIETNLTTANFENQSPLNDDDFHDDSINSNSDKAAHATENDVHDLNAETSVNSSDESQEVEKNTEKNSSLNLTSISLAETSESEKTKENLMQQIRAKFNKLPQDFPPLENSTPKKNVQKKKHSVSKQRRSKINSLEDKMSSRNIENLGDGKYLYKNAWPFHIIENQEAFSCDTCQCQIGFYKNPQIKLYTHIIRHIREEHTNPTGDAAENGSDGKFRFLDKWTFEKVELGFKCGHCPKIHTTIKSMERHIQICHIPGKFKCSKCPHSCRTRGLLNRHSCGWNLQGSRKSYEISPGSGKMVYIGEKQNWDFELMDGKFHCSSCPVVTMRRSQMLSHFRLFHEDAVPRNGRVLKRVGNGKFRFMDKWAFDKVEFGFKCGHCPKICKKLCGMKAHIEIWHVTGKFQCSKCPRSFRTRSRLKRHSCSRGLEMASMCLEISPGSGKFIYNGKKQNWDFELVDGKFQCLTCPAFKRKKANLINHLRDCHDALTSHMCEKCGKIFSQKGGLNKHKLVHLENGNRDDGRKRARTKTPGVCPHCQKTYKSKAGLGIHIFRSHKDIVMTTTTTADKEKGQGNSGSLKYPCGKCTRIFTSAVLLKKHEDRHAEVLDCPKCEKKFKTSAEARAHLDRHNKVFKFFCDVCNKGFLQKWQVTRHKETGAHSQKEETVKSKEASIHFKAKAKTQKDKRNRKEQDESESSEEEEEASASEDETEESESEDSDADATTEED